MYLHKAGAAYVLTERMSPIGCFPVPQWAWGPRSPQGSLLWLRQSPHQMDSAPSFTDGETALPQAALGSSSTAPGWAGTSGPCHLVLAAHEAGALST